MTIAGLQTHIVEISPLTKKFSSLLSIIYLKHIKQQFYVKSIIHKITEASCTFKRKNYNEFVYCTISLINRIMHYNN